MGQIRNQRSTHAKPTGHQRAIYGQPTRSQRETNGNTNWKPIERQLKHIRKPTETNWAPTGNTRHLNITQKTRYLWGRSFSSVAYSPFGWARQPPGWTGLPFGRPRRPSAFRQGLAFEGLRPRRPSAFEASTGLQNGAFGPQSSACEP